MTDAMATHSEPELLAAFVDGHLDREQLQVVTAHLASCEECRAVIGEAVAFEREERAERSPRRMLLSIAAAVAVAIIAYPFVRGYLHQREMREEVQEVHAAQVAMKKRVVEARFSGQDIYARYSPMRGAPSENEPTPGPTPEESKLEEATLNLLVATEKDTSPAALRFRAFAQTVGKDLGNPLETIEKIPEDKRDAATWNDIAAVACSTNKFDIALTAVDRALQLEPKMPEALFNRAVILRLMSKPEAAAAWKAYLAVDPRSAWADEARYKQNPIQ